MLDWKKYVIFARLKLCQYIIRMILLRTFHLFIDLRLELSIKIGF